MSDWRYDKFDAVGLDKLTTIEQTRRSNLRQLLTRTTRNLNERVLERLRERGYHDVRLAHGSLLINLDLKSNTITEMAERAHMPKQAMSKLASELEAMGFIERTRHPVDGRAWCLGFTRKGLGLVKHTIAIVGDVEREAAAAVGRRRYVEMCADLRLLEELWSSSKSDDPDD
ncbi:MAG: hypothetical protein NVSMB59_16410 [Vulcanimicrobiaceae bacterium]